MSEVQVTTRIPEELRREFKLTAVQRSESMSDLLRRWIQAYVDHHKEEK